MFTIEERDKIVSVLMEDGWKQVSSIAWIFMRDFDVIELDSKGKFRIFVKGRRYRGEAETAEDLLDTLRQA